MIMDNGLDSPHCPVHLESLVVVGAADNSRDAGWVCPVEGFRYVAVA